ncbi:MAG: ABC transporter substrate-binding protein [candidate division WOR-3 bacterium]|nr:ABC transporter substrate-binding protein [candidate division WOR-3 bacterium]MCX7757730.1 ABC transporter substrate-binding protein [candidate division WOR-3 bacterium]MDW7988157.1 ABC transporter substrate-binding protein [candidate division WOR-3 bacterium]
MKKLGALFTLFLIIFLNCSKKHEVTEITFWHAMGGQVERTLQAMVAEFCSTHKDIRIKLVGMADYNVLAQKLMSACAIGKPPTIAQMYENWTTQLLLHDHLTPLDSFIFSADGLTKEEIADIWQVLIDNNSWNGRVVTLPFNKSVPVYYYNVAILETLGYKEFPRTWNEFLVLMRKVKERYQGRIIPTIGGTDIWVVASMIYQEGGRLFDEEHFMPLFYSEPAIKSLEFQVDLIYKDSVQGQTAVSEALDDFLAKRVFCVPLSCARRAVMLENETFKVGMAPLPYNNKPAAIIYGTNIGMFKKSTPKEKIAAWKFIKWFTAKDQQIRWSLNTYYVPIQKSALEDSRMQEHFRKTPGLKDAYYQMAYAVFEPKGEAWFEGRKIFIEDALENAALGKLSPQDALKFAQEKLLARIYNKSHSKK